MWKDTHCPHSCDRIITVPWKACRIAQMSIFLCTDLNNKHSTVIFITPLTHTEVWKLILTAAGMSVVTQFVEPVMFGCYEEVPGQQGANAHQKEDDVHQTVRVLWSVAHSQRHCGMFGQELCRGTLVLILIILRYLMVAKSSWKIGGVEARLHWLCAFHFHRQNTGCSQIKDKRKGGGWGNKEIVRQEVL